MSYFFGFVLLFKKGEVFDNGEHVYKSFKADVTHVPPIDDFPQRDGASRDGAVNEIHVF